MATAGRARPPAVCVVAAVLLASVSACGSTVEPVTGADGRPQTTAGLSVDRPDMAAQTPTTVAAHGTSTHPSAARLGPGPGGDPTTPPSEPASAGTAGPLSVGFLVYDAGRTNAFLGAVGSDQAVLDGSAAVEALVARVNADGGIAGREVEPVIHLYDPTGDNDAEYQRACANFTQDHDVFASVSLVDADGMYGFIDCMAGSETVLITESRFFVDDILVAGWFPYVYLPGTIRTERWTGVIDQLVATRFFDDDARLGIVYWDDVPQRRALDETIRPRLAMHGVRPAAEAAINPRAAAEVQSAILRFRTSGVTHVIFIGTWGGVEFFWFPEAESQGYRPRYGLMSPNLPSLAASNAAAANQLRGAVGVGWQPVTDVDIEDDPKLPASTRCLAIAQEAGIDLSSSFARWQMQMLCSGAWLLQSALPEGAAATAADLRGRVEAMGGDFESPLTFSTRFGPGIVDGAASARHLAFVDECVCFRYTSELVPL